MVPKKPHTTEQEHRDDVYARGLEIAKSPEGVREFRRKTKTREDYNNSMWNCRLLKTLNERDKQIGNKYRLLPLVWMFINKAITDNYQRGNDEPTCGGPGR